MAGGFSFPPPPPPPPKASAAGEIQNSPAQRGSGPGFRGRGRGRGSNPSRGSFRGGRGNHQGHQNGNLSARFRKNYQNRPESDNVAPQDGYDGYTNNEYQGGYHTGYANNYTPPMPLQSGFQNPAFQITPFMQARFYNMMQNHALAQSQGILGGNSFGYPNGWPSNSPPNWYATPSESTGIPPTQPPQDNLAGRKRKHQGPEDAENSPKSNNTGGVSSYSETAPAVPSFGAPLPQVTPASAPKPSEHAKLHSRAASSTNDKVTEASTKPRTRSRKKRKTNQLGLTPAGEDREESEDDEGEEARLAAMVAKTGPAAVSYNGKTMVLKTKDDVAAWIEQRRKNWPTRAKVEERQRVQRVREKARKVAAEAEEKRKDGQKMEAVIKKRDALDKKTKDQNIEVEPKKPHGEEQLSKSAKKKKKKKESAARKNDASLREQQEQLRQKLVESADKKKAEQDELRQKLLASANKEKQKSTKSDTKHKKQDNIPSAKSLANAEPELSKVEQIRKMLEEAEKEEAEKKAVQTAVAEPSNQSENSSEVSSDDSSSSEISSDSDSDDMHSDSNSDALSETVPPSPPAADLIVDVESIPSSPSSSSASSSHSSLPAESTSKPPQAPDQPNKQLPKGVCHKYYKTGRCHNGSRCKYPHKKPQNKEEGQPDVETGRKTVYQRMVEQEHAKENELVYAAIKAMGEKGLFEED